MSNESLTVLYHQLFGLNLRKSILRSRNVTKLTNVFGLSTCANRLTSNYRAMHFSAKRGIAIACRLSVCLSVCNVGEL